MCIIQIWTTCICSSAYKLVEISLGCMLRSHARNGNEFKTPGHRCLPEKHSDAWFLNSSKSKTRLKFMKLGMLSWSGINMLWEKKFPFGAGLGISISQTRASHNKHDGFDREHPTFGDETISIASCCFQFFSSVNIEQQGCCVNFCDSVGVVWICLCVNWVFNAFKCIIQIWTTCTCSSAYKLVEKSNMCPEVHASVPCKKWEWISNTGAPLIAGKTLRYLVFKFK